jgi:hypothetical protein
MLGRGRVADQAGGGDILAAGAGLAHQALKVGHVHTEMQQGIGIATGLGIFVAGVDGAGYGIFHTIDVEMVQVLLIANIAVPGWDVRACISSKDCWSSRYRMGRPRAGLLGETMGLSASGYYTPSLRPGC